MKTRGKNLRLSAAAVRSFFDERARKVTTLGPLCAVLYQDSNPHLAAERHRVEQELIGRKLFSEEFTTILDVGCGTGRWADLIVPKSIGYTGIDFCAGLLAFARKRHRAARNARFLRASIAEELPCSLAGKKFDRILSLGVMIYLNDKEMMKALDNMILLAESENSKIIMREPVGTDCRLTLKNHYSEELGQTYNAIYRSSVEFSEILDFRLGTAGFKCAGHGKMYRSNRLNNRRETFQKWFVYER